VPLISQAAYARHRGISRVAVHLRTVTKGGPIPVHTAKKLIDPAEADALWDATKSRARWTEQLGAIGVLTSADQDSKSITSAPDRGANCPAIAREHACPKSRATPRFW